MGNYEQLIAAIEQVIKTNGNNEITGAILQNTLKSIVNSIGTNATFAGIATPTTNPGTPDQNVFYLATEAGTYSNFGGKELKGSSLVIFYNIKDGTWRNNVLFSIDQDLDVISERGIANQVVARITSLFNKLWKNELLPSVTIYEGYVDNTGLIRNALVSAADHYTDYIPVEPNMVYTYIGGLLDTRSVAIYDADKVFIKSYPGAEIAGNGKIVTSFSFNMPNKAAYIRCSVYSETPTSYKVYKNGISMDLIIETINENIETINENIETINENIETINENIETINENIGAINVDYLNISSNDYDESAINKYINNFGDVLSGFDGDKCTNFIEVEGNTLYRYIGKFTDGRGYAEYNSEKVFIRGYNALQINPSTREVTQLTIKTSENTKFVRFSVYAVDNYTLEKVISPSIADRLNFIEDELDNLFPDEQDYECNFPPYLFAIDNDSSNFYAREYVQYLYPEGLLRTAIPVKINGGLFLGIQKTAKNTDIVEETNFNVSLSESGYKTKRAEVKLIKTKASVAKNKSIRYLAIGDSITANQKPNMQGIFVGGWCYPSVAKEMLMMDNIDFGDSGLLDMLLIGTTNVKETYFDYKDKSQLKLRGCSEGRGSWTTSNYLRHAAHTITTHKESSSTSFINKAAWDALGLGRKISIDAEYSESSDYDEYDYSVEKRNLIRTTPWGKYHWDYSAELWNAAKNNNKNNIMTDVGEYTGSAKDKELLDEYMNYMLDNPSNPFFDRNVAKSTGSYAFSLATYLSRYKTLQDDGKTRLIVGDTAGSLVSDVSRYDVCTPTHITIELGENDRWWYPTTAEETCNDIKQLISIINSEYPNIYVGFVNPRYLGVFYPELWKNIFCGTLGEGTQFKYDMNVIMQNELKDLAESNKKNYFLPCYYTQSPLYRQNSRYDISLMDKGNVIVGSTDPNHPGLFAYWSIAYDVLSWIYYTLKA